MRSVRRGRVAAAGWLFDTLDKTLEMAKVTAEVTHNHPEGIKGAPATAAAIFLARTGHSKPEIRQYVEQTFGYDLSRTCDEIRPGYRHVEICQQTVPEAIVAFLESTGFEDALRNAVEAIKALGYHLHLDQGGDALPLHPVPVDDGLIAEDRAALLQLPELVLYLCLGHACLCGQLCRGLRAVLFQQFQ